MSRTTTGPGRGQLAVLFLLQGVGLAAWFVPLSPVLEAHGYAHLRALAFATTAVAALVTPLFFGALADRHVPPVHVLRGLAVATATFQFLTGLAIDRGWSPPALLGLIQLQAFASTPTWSLLTSIALASMGDAKREFGPVRAFGTFGWIGGCLLVSALGADASTRAAYTGSAVWVVLAAFTLRVPAVAVAATGESLTIRQRLGLDALDLLRHPDHRVVFVASALLAIPLSAFYPYTPSFLKDLGLQRISAWMSIAQVTEVVAMFGLAALLARWRLKWVLATGLSFAILRYLLFASHQTPWVLLGVSLHGFGFTLWFVTLPIYLNERIDAAWRTRAQALLSLMTQGVGNLTGYLGTGAWLEACRTPTGTLWTRYWSGLALVVALVSVYFLAAYRGRAAHPPAAHP